MMLPINKNISSSKIFYFLEGNTIPIFLKKVIPHSAHWNDYLSLSMDYFNESWPELFQGKSKISFEVEYEKKLIQRSLEGNRGLFFFQSSDTIVGLSNVYVSSRVIGSKEFNSLEIAEFYIKPEFRGKGLGRNFLQEIINWSNDYSPQIISIEVDSNLLLANKFWKNFNFNFIDISDSRCLYWQHLNSVSF